MLVLAAGGLSPHEITVFLLSLGLLLGLAKLLGELATAWGQPSVLGELLAGVLLGPTVLGAVAPGWYDALFPTGSNNALALETLVTLSAVLLLLVAGLEVDLSAARRQGRATAWVSLAGMVVPFATGFALAWVWPGGLGLTETDQKLPFALFIGIALSITALPVIAKILIDLHLSKSDLGALILSSAMINDLVGWIGFAMVLSLMAGGGAAAGDAVASGAVGGGGSVAVTVGATLLFIGGMLTLGRVALDRALPVVQAHTTWPGGTLVFVFVAAMLCSALTEWLGVHSIFGAFIVGVALGSSRHLRERTRDTIHQFVTHIFAPIFFASIALRVDFIGSFNPGMVLIVLTVAILGKVLGCYAGARWAGLQHRESWATGFGMCARGAMEIILAQLAFDAGLIGQELFVAIVVMALVTSLMAGPAMQRLLRRKQQRRITDFASEKAFVPELGSRDARGAIDALAAAAAGVAGVEARAIADAAWQREQAVPTGLPDGLAVPHARLPGVRRPVMAIGLSDRGVDFDAPDGKPARIICLLVSDAHEQESQLEMLKLIGETFSQPAARQEVLSARGFTQLRAALTVAANAPSVH